MKAVHKIQLNPGPQVSGVALPEGAKFLTAQIQGEHIAVWYEVNPLVNEMRMRHLVVVGTGQEFKDHPMAYIATVQNEWMVWHVYEGLS